MKRVWAEKTTDQQQKSSLQIFLYHLLVDIIPVLLLLAAMAYGMAFVSQKITEPRSVEIQAPSEKLS